MTVPYWYSSSSSISSKWNWNWCIDMNAIDWMYTLAGYGYFIKLIEFLYFLTKCSIRTAQKQLCKRAGSTPLKNIFLYVVLIFIPRKLRIPRKIPCNCYLHRYLFQHFLYMHMVWLISIVAIYPSTIKWRCIQKENFFFFLIQIAEKTENRVVNWC